MPEKHIILTTSGEIPQIVSRILRLIRINYHYPFNVIASGYDRYRDKRNLGCHEIYYYDGVHNGRHENFAIFHIVLKSKFWKRSYFDLIVGSNLDENLIRFGISEIPQDILLNLPSISWPDDDDE